MAFHINQEGDFDFCTYENYMRETSSLGYHNADGTFTCTCGEPSVNFCACITISIDEKYKGQYYYKISSDYKTNVEYIADGKIDDKAVNKYLDIKDITKDVDPSTDNRILQPVVRKEAQEYFMKKHADIIEKHGDIDGLGVIHRDFYIPFIGKNQTCVPLKIQLVDNLRRGPVICKVTGDDMPTYSFTYL